MFSKSNESWSHMEMKSPDVSICVAFCSSVSLCGTNREQIFRLPRSSWTMVFAVSLLMPNSSTINHCVSRRSCTSICRNFSIISGDLLVDSQLQRGSSPVLSFPSRKRLNLSYTHHFLSYAKALEPFVNTFSAHGFPPVHLHQQFTRFRSSFP